MSDWVKKLIGIQECFNCNKYITKKQVYSVDVDTQDGPLHLKLCQDCSGDFDDMMKDLEENLNAQRNNTL